MIEIASLSRYTEIIPGMCDDDKFHALLEVARRAVEGDIVEIGSWWGKSAFIFSWLARYFGIGKLLCVDPWDNQHLVQGEKIVDSGSAQVDAEEALQVFQIGLLPFNANHINYLRMTSVEGAAHYAGSRSVNSEVFGKTEYAGSISILHIDGNHAYAAVKADIESWQPFMREGGWIIFDDYVWPFGDGPHRAGDEFLESYQSGIATAFVMGTALFIQMSSSSA
jgi:cephalosporin hydroxylase